jgi:hypothetical protein
MPPPQGVVRMIIIVASDSELKCDEMAEITDV